MRRWLALLLIVLLPLQSSWAAVAGHLGHASTPPGGILGLLDHDHRNCHGHVGDGGPADVQAGITAEHHDCGHCHGHWVGVLGLAMTAAVPPSRSSRPLAGEARGGETWPSQPERPQWRRLA